MGFDSLKGALAADRDICDGEAITFDNGAASDSSTRAVIMRNEAELWISENPDAWAAIVSAAKAEAAADRRFSVRLIVDSACRIDRASIDGGRTSANHNAIAALSRLLLEQHPDLKPFVNLRRSLCDRAFGDVA